jgi:hypothetical protein
MNQFKSKEPTCPNCDEPLPNVATVTATGVLVCCADCARGWMNGERTASLLKAARAMLVAT